MSSTKDAQAARNAADRRLRDTYPEEFAALMHEEHAKRGLTWNRRATPEERARREAEEKQAKAKARIEAEAAKAGLSISFNLPVETEWDEGELVHPIDAIVAVQDEERAQRVEEKILDAWDASA
jgi:hypothetical protein